MSNATRIEWTDATWNPVTGCDAVSPGCDHCYARAMAHRFAGRSGYPAAPREFDVTLHPERLAEPLRWRKPRRVFVVSMGDLFHHSVPDEFIDRVWAVMAACPQHTFQVLTKRADRMRDYLTALYQSERWLEALWHCGRAVKTEGVLSAIRGVIPLPNVWLGVTAEDQTRADERVPLLLQTPAAVRFVSCEPLLGPVDLGLDLLESHHDDDLPDSGFMHSPTCSNFCDYGCGGYETLGGLHWVICGGETGPQARATHRAWARSLRDQCAHAGVPFFFKRWGAWLPDGVDPNEEYAHVQYTGSMQSPDQRLLDGVDHHAWPEVAR